MSIQACYEFVDDIISTVMNPLDVKSLSVIYSSQCKRSLNDVIDLSILSVSCSPSFWSIVVPGTFVPSGLPYKCRIRFATDEKSCRFIYNLHILC